MRQCTSTKSIDGGSGSERVPCDGAVVMVRGEAKMLGGCGEPCSFVMEREDPVEAAFRAGYRAGHEAGFKAPLLQTKTSFNVGFHQAWNIFEAYRRYKSGERPSYSTFIDEQTLTAGYGQLHPSGSWEFPLHVDQTTHKIVERN